MTIPAVMSMTAIDLPLEIIQGDSMLLKFRGRYENGNPPDLTQADINFNISYTVDSKNASIFEASLDNGLVTWEDEAKCIFKVYIPNDALLNIKFPLKQPKQLICKYSLSYNVTGYSDFDTSRTLFASTLTIHRI